MAAARASNWTVLHYYKIKGLCPCLASDHRLLSQGQRPLPLPSSGSHFTITRSRGIALAEHGIRLPYHKVNGLRPCLVVDCTALSQDQGPLPFPLRLLVLH